MGSELLRKLKCLRMRARITSALHLELGPCPIDVAYTRVNLFSAEHATDKRQAFPPMRWSSSGRVVVTVIGQSFSKSLLLIVDNRWIGRPFLRKPARNLKRTLVLAVEVGMT